MNKDKSTWGWNDTLESSLQAFGKSGLIPGRVIRENRGQYLVTTGEKVFRGEISGAFRYKVLYNSDYPVIGDWVMCRAGDDSLIIIEAVLPRMSSFSRKEAGERTEEQVMAANVDIIGLVFGINGGRNFTAGALERYLVLAWESGAKPVVILNKADLATVQERENAVLITENCAPGVDIFLVSAATGEGLSSFYFEAGKTIAFIGPSGVGKSTLINALAGTTLQETMAQREGDLRGRHTTTTRELFLLNSGVMLIDSPGLREIQLWASSESADETFSDIVGIAAGCRFMDCTHTGEPGCAVQAALASGELEYRRYENYLELRKELDYLNTRKNEQVSRQKGKDLAKLIKDMKKSKKRNGY